MSLPPLAEIPPTTIRLAISPEEWQACLESWLTLSEAYLRLPEKTFQELSAGGSSLVEFVPSFYHEKVHANHSDATFNNAAFNNSTGSRLIRTCFLLVHRMITGSSSSTKLLEFNFLADFCRTHERNNSALSALLAEIWKRTDNVFEVSMEKTRKRMIQSLDSQFDENLTGDLFGLASIMKASSNVGKLFMTGSDFLDGLVVQYSRAQTPQQRNVIISVANLGFQSLLQTEIPNVSLLSDHMYSIKVAAESAKSKQTLAAGLVNYNSFLATFRKRFTGPGGERINKLLDALETYRTSPLQKKPIRRKPSKGKSKAVDNDGEMHMHRMSLVTQIQDLFPDLGSAFVLKLLDEYNENVEQVTAHLLDDSLPPYLKDLDRTEEVPAFHSHSNGNIESLEPRSTPPSSSFVPERRNIFDDDELDRLDFDTSRLHVGKKEDVSTETQANKAAILSALAAFDSDDDERDDTYDVDDVGGTVDTAHSDGEPGSAERDTFNENDMILYSKYILSPDIFARASDARKKKARHALKAETRMTDEAIEGWAIMLRRDPRRFRRLEAQFNSFDGKQAEVARTAYREGMEGTETEDSDVPSTRGGFRGGFRGRGRGRGRGGNVTGPSEDPKTAVARERKEAKKGSRANHNRRDQRARKMARGGFAG